MTEIRVQRKERRSAKWPWLLLLLIPIAWFVLRDDDRTDERSAGTVADTSAHVAPAASDTAGTGAGVGGATSTGIDSTRTGTAGTGTPPAPR